MDGDLRKKVQGIQCETIQPVDSYLYQGRLIEAHES